MNTVLSRRKLMVAAGVGAMATGIGALPQPVMAAASKPPAVAATNMVDRPAGVAHFAGQRDESLSPAGVSGISSEPADTDAFHFGNAGPCVTRRQSRFMVTMPFTSTCDPAIPEVVWGTVPAGLGTAVPVVTIPFHPPRLWRRHADPLSSQELSGTARTETHMIATASAGPAIEALVLLAQGSLEQP